MKYYHHRQQDRQNQYMIQHFHNHHIQKSFLYFFEPVVDLRKNICLFQLMQEMQYSFHHFRNHQANHSSNDLLIQMYFLI